MPKVITVAAAVIYNEQNKILISRRPAGKAMAGLWEFPGGKVEIGETPEDALLRELKEELNLTTQSVDIKPLTFVSHGYEDFHLLMLVYTCRQWRGQMIAQEGQETTWVMPADLENYAMPPADMPILPFLL